MDVEAERLRALIDESQALLDKEPAHCPCGYCQGLRHRLEAFDELADALAATPAAPPWIDVECPACCQRFVTKDYQAGDPTRIPTPAAPPPADTVRQLREAVDYLVSLLEHGKPRKLDDALTWRENEELARARVQVLFGELEAATPAAPPCGCGYESIGATATKFVGGNHAPSCPAARPDP